MKKISIILIAITFIFNVTKVKANEGMWLPFLLGGTFVLSGEGVSSLSFGEIWHFFETQLNYPLTVLDTDYFTPILEN